MSSTSKTPKDTCTLPQDVQNHPTNQQGLISMSWLLPNMLSLPMTSIWHTRFLRVVSIMVTYLKTKSPQRQFDLSACHTFQLQNVDAGFRTTRQRPIFNTIKYSALPLLSKLLSHFACRRPVTLLNSCSAAITSCWFCLLLIKHDGCTLVHLLIQKAKFTYLQIFIFFIFWTCWAKYYYAMGFWYSYIPVIYTDKLNKT